MIYKVKTGYFCQDLGGNQNDLTIAASGTKTNGTDFYGSVNVEGVEKLAVQLIAKGDNAASSGNVTFNFRVNTDGSNFDTVNYSSQTLALNGTSTERKTVQIDVTGVREIELYTVVNGDAIYGISTVNAKFNGAIFC